MNASILLFRLSKAKTFLMFFLLIWLFAGCKRKDVELATINAAAYVDGNKATANFVLLDPSQSTVIGDEDAIDRYLATKPIHAQYAVTEYTEKVIPGEYILVIQIKEIGAPVLYKTYTYNFITTRGTSAKPKYVMQFTSGSSLAFQPWVDKK